MRVQIIRMFILKIVYKGICYENVTACCPQVKKLPDIRSIIKRTKNHYFVDHYDKSFIHFF